MVNFLDQIFNPWLGYVFLLPSFWAILIVSAFITIIITVVYKYTTNQSEMKRLKTDLKQYQKQMRETKDTKKLMDIQKKAMDINMKYMGASLKSTLYTFIPIIIIFSWLNMHIAYEPILPNTEFIVTTQFAQGAKGTISLTTTPELQIKSSSTQTIEGDVAKWTLSGDAGEYKLNFKYNEEEHTGKVLITQENYDIPSYAAPDQPIKDSKLKMIKIGTEKVKPFGDTFNLFGWYPGWLFTYIVSSIAFSALFRKIMDVY